MSVFWHINMLGVSVLVASCSKSEMLRSHICINLSSLPQLLSYIKELFKQKQKKTFNLIF